MRLVSVAAVIALAVCLLQLALPVAGSHFAYGIYSWIRVASTTNQWDFRVEMAYRRSFFGSPNVGSTIVPGSMQIGNGGYGTSNYLNSNVNLVIALVYSSQDYVVGVYTPPRLTLPVSGYYYLYFSMCARLSTLIDNRDLCATMAAKMDPTQCCSPKTTGMPREYFAVNQPVYYVVPGQSPQLLPITYRTATTSESSLSYPQPRQASVAFSLNQQTGQITWTPNTVGLYAYQVRVLDGYNEVPLDFLMQVDAQCTASTCNTPPSFVPAVPNTPVTVYRGVQKTITIQSTDVNTQDTTSVQTSVLPDGATFTLISSSGVNTYYTLAWIPPLDATSSSVCFKAQDSRGAFSLGNYCIALNIGVASIIYVSGIIRDFLPSHPDFNRAGGPLDDGKVFVKTSLGSDGKPQFDTTAGATSVASATSFGDWFNDIPSVNQKIVYSLTLSNGTAADGRIFTFLNTNFYPIDGLLQGNDMGTSPNHNGRYTYEIHTYMTYNGAEVFTLQASDDLWVFINYKLPNGWNMQGVHPLRTFTLNMDQQAAYLGLTKGQTYRVDIFYAHRTSAHAPGLQLELPNAVLCDALQSGIVQFNIPAGGFGSFANNFSPQGKARIDTTTGYLQPISTVLASTLSDSGAIWYAQPVNNVPVAVPLKVLHGFQALFSFSIQIQSGDSNAEGFAFVLQGASAVARGSEGGNLGYGTIVNSIAIEFDSFTNTENSDPNYNHVSIHTRYTTPNSANEAYNLAVSNNDPPMTLTNWTAANNYFHNVRIEYAPAVEDPNCPTCPLLGWIRVWMNTVLKPVAEAQVDGVVLNQMFNGAAYVGFTAGSSDARHETVNIRSWKLTIVPSSASQSALVAQPQPLRAGDVGTVKLQMRDACSNKIINGGELSSITASIQRAQGTSTPVVPSIVDNNDGSYTMTYSLTYTGVMTFPITFGGLPVKYSPFAFTVGAGATVASASTFQYSMPPLKVQPNQGLASFGLYVVVIDPAYGDVKGRYQYDFTNAAPLGAPYSGGTAAFNTLISNLAAGQIVAIAVIGDASAQKAATGVAASFSAIGAPAFTVGSGDSYAFVGVKGEAVSTTWRVQNAGGPASVGPRSFPGGSPGAPFTVTVNSGGTLWGANGAVFVTPTTYVVYAGVPSTFTIIAKDQFGNLNTDGGDPFSLSFTPDITTFGGTSSIAAAPYAGYYDATFTSQRSGAYSMYVKLAGVTVGSGQAASVTVLAGPAVASMSSATGTGTVATTATQSTSFDLNLLDQFSNQITSASRFDNITARLAGVINGQNVVVPISCPTQWTTKLTCTYTAVKAGSYGLFVYINGGLMPVSTQVQVSAGNVAAQFSQAHVVNAATDPSTVPVAAGTLCSFEIQARDANGNDRQVTNDGTAAFSVKYSKTVTNPTLAYNGGGSYLVTYTPIQAGPLKIEVNLTRTGPFTTQRIGSPKQPMTITVQPGAADSVKTTMTWAGYGAALTGTAGAPVQYRITSRDGQGNLRNLLSEPTAYSVLVKQGVITLAGTVANSLPASYANYTVSFTAFTSGTYQVFTKLTSTGADVSPTTGPKSPFDVFINPGATNTSRCVVSGSGFSGGTDSQPATFTVQARDSWNNNQIGTGDQFRMKIGASITAATASGGGLYTFTYTVPARQCSNNCPFEYFTITVERFISGSTWQQVAITTTARTIINNAASYAVVQPNPLGTGITGQVNRFFVIDKTQSGQIQKNGQVFKVTICDKTNPLDCIGNVLVTPALGGVNDFNYTVTYTPPRIGNWNVTVLWQGIVKSAASPFKLTTTFGAVNSGAASNVPATTVANVPGTFDVTLFDIAGQTVSTTSLTVQATLDSGIVGQAQTVTGVWMAATKVWRFTFQRQKAGSYVVSVFLSTNPSKNLIGTGTNIVIVPAAASATHTVVSGLGLTQATAGVTAQFDIAAFDQFDNPIDNAALAAQFSCSIAVAGTTCSPTQYRALSGGLMTGSYTTTKSLGGVTPYTLTITLNGVSIGTTYNLVVQPAAISPTLSAVTGQNAVTAGQTMSFTLTCKDIFNNEWLSGPRVLRALVTPPLPYPGADPPQPYEADVTSLGGSVFTISLDGAFTTYIGAYSWVVTVDEVPVAFPSLHDQQVNAGPTDPRQTTYGGGVVPSLLAVAQNATIMVQLHDAGGNPRLGAPKESVTVEFVVGQTACSSSSDADTPVALQPVATKFRYDVHYKGNGSYALVLFGTQTGTFSANISVNGVSLGCQAMHTLTMQIGPDAPSAATSSFSPTSQTVSANDKVSLVVTLRDRFGNPSPQPITGTSTKDYEPTRQKIGLQITGNGLVGSAWNYNVTTNDATSQSDTSPRTYTIVFQVRAANPVGSPYSFAATYNGVPLTGGAAGSLTIRAGSARTPLFGTIPTPFAGEPAYFDLSALDVFGNAVVLASPSPSHTYEVVMLPQNKALQGYSITSTVTLLNDLARHRVAFQSAWAGTFDVTATLIDASRVRQKAATTTITFKPATCASVDATKPYRCPDNSCAASYAACPTITMCPSDKPIRCATDDSCQATARECPCPSGQSHCPATGQCVVNQNTDCLQPPTCPEGTLRCLENGQFTGQCRAKLSDCPAPFVCTPGFVMCPDGISCASSLSGCVDVTTLGSCPSGMQRCPTTDCVEKLEDCPTSTTCPSGQVLCSDGSCQTDATKCAFQFECYAPNPVRCSDGSCRATVSACPTAITCPLGFLLCPSNQCVKDSADCLPIPSCPATSVRCPDGSCRDNIVLCPSEMSCPVSSPVLCSDGSCTTSVYLCSAPRSCPSGSSVCPDGSCVTGGAQCASGKTCPAAQPVLCPDGSCVAQLSACVALAPCPVNAAVRCPSGACRASLVDCPTSAACPSTLPVRCLDGNCVLAAELCPSINATACKGATPVRCPGGECAASQSLCPTHLTCAQGTTKCIDGTCRDVCPTLTLGQDVTQCATGQVRCPQTGFGVTCALTLAQCPQAPVCPVDKPVKCMDVTCAATAADCPQVTGSWPPNLVACSDYTFKPSLSECATVVTCPSAYPYKCYDDSCRKAPTDCPQPPQCPSETPFLCPNGKCVDRLWDPACGSAVVFCFGTTPVKCPTGVCAASADKCPAIYDDNQAVVIDDSSLCPAGWFRCRDGSCAESQEQCLPLSCPNYLPYLCFDGLCTTDASLCNYENGCPWNKPTKCWNGACAASLSDCPARPVPPATACPSPDRQYNCPDGSCAADATSCTSAQQNGCPTNKFPCLDKRCVSKPQSADDVNPCVSGATTTNTCPASRPFRCTSGYCAVSSIQCPILPFTCGSDNPVPCADGSCVQSSLQCPVVFSCAPGFRCGDGSCRDDVTQCPLVNTCPTVNGQQLVRCDNGMCAASIGACIDEKTGCPANANYKCNNGACVSSSSLCASVTLPSNGCPPGNSTRCSNGACKPTTADCPLTNGCPRALPFRCLDGTCMASTASCNSAPYNAVCDKIKCADGSCVTTAAACATSTGCPVSTPLRCGDGKCVRLSSECAPVVVCEALQTLCYDGSCVSSASLCPPRAPCGAGLKQCSDGTCKAQCSTGGVGTAGSGCPPGSPVLCAGGVCKASLSQCPSTPNTPVPNLANSCPTSAPYQCFDGSCKASYSQCISFSTVVAGKGASTTAEQVCPEGQTLCSNGACVENAYECAIVPACPWDRPLRCWDGSCVSTANGGKCTAEDMACSTLGAQYRRCEDGVCRLSCLQYDGCGLQAPFHCANRLCAVTADQCKAAETFPEEMTNMVWVDPATQTAAPVPTPSVADPSGTDTTGFLDPQYDPKAAHPCYSNCRNQLKASPLVVSVDNTVDTTISLVVDSARMVQTKLLLPSGAIRIRSDASSLAKPVMTIRPVGESKMRGVVNRVTLSRRPDFGGIKYLTFPWTVVSPAFECGTDAQTSEPFKVPLSVVASSDRDNLPLFKDICLGYIYSVPDVDYRAWRCVEDTIEKRLNNSVRSTTTNATEAAYVVKANLYACRSGPTSSTVFAFVVVPARDLGVYQPEVYRFWAENLIWIVLGICGGGLIFFLVFYTMKRLHRYRAKYKETDKKVAQMQEEVDEMEQFGGSAGQKDEALEMMSNPMVVQMKDMQARLDRKNKEVLEEEAKRTEEEAAARAEHLQKLQEDRNNLAAELERLKAELAASESKPKKVDADDIELGMAGGDDGGAGAAAAAKPAKAKPAATRAQFDSKPAGGRKKKEID